MKDARGFIPPVDPSAYAGEACLLVRYPDSPEYLAILTGAIRALESWQAYARTGDRRGVDTAQAFKTRLQLEACTGSGGTCSMQLRQSLTNPCQLEYSLDCTNWHVIFDASLCGGYSPANVITPASAASAASGALQGAYSAASGAYSASDPSPAISAAKGALQGINSEVRKHQASVQLYNSLAKVGASERAAMSANDAWWDSLGAYLATLLDAGNELISTALDDLTSWLAGEANSASDWLKSALDSGALLIADIFNLGTLNDASGAGFGGELWDQDYTLDPCYWTTYYSSYVPGEGFAAHPSGTLGMNTVSGPAGPCLVYGTSVNVSAVDLLITGAGAHSLQIWRTIDTAGNHIGNATAPGAPSPANPGWVRYAFTDDLTSSGGIDIYGGFAVTLRIAGARIYGRLA